MTTSDFLKEDGTIKRPRNSYMIYLTEVREKKAKEADEKEHASNLCRRIGNDWKSLPEEVKRGYKRKSLLERQLHKKLFPGYKFCPLKREVKKLLKLEARKKKKISILQQRLEGSQVSPYENIESQEQCNLQSFSQLAAVHRVNIDTCDYINNISVQEYIDNVIDLDCKSDVISIGVIEEQKCIKVEEEENCFMKEELSDTVKDGKLIIDQEDEIPFFEDFLFESPTIHDDFNFFILDQLEDSLDNFESFYK